ncbi:unnamed protein product [Durusdinium trenchii]|uniref:Uncharacterized protein n=1 Tax=Durusdinium trenchii TaxID=1381693 RepID=A0ABP0PMR8_9DINO
MSKEKDVAVDESWGPRLAAGLGFPELWKSNMCCESYGDLFVRRRFISFQARMAEGLFINARLSQTEALVFLFHPFATYLSSHSHVLRRPQTRKKATVID